MITPEEIKKEAQSWYKAFLSASLRNEAFFPREIRFGKIKASETLGSFSKIQGEIQNLKLHSRERSGYGYVVDFIKRKDKKIGEQYFPQKIYFENRDEYLKFIAKEKEFQKFRVVADQIRESIPALDPWICRHPFKVIDHLHQWGDLIKVCRYFLAHPKPSLYIRELPIVVHTKFIEENKSIIRGLLDFLIGDQADQSENNFEKKFHLKRDEPLIRIRILDQKIARKSFYGLSDLSIPQSQFCQLDLECRRVFILENKTNFSNIFNFLTFPYLEASIAVFGKGFQLELLKEAKWLEEKQIIYWGDIDPHGFQILSQLRSHFPHTRSLMMDFETFSHFNEFRVDSPEIRVVKLENLTHEENQLFERLLNLKDKNRLEQEKINHAFALQKIFKLSE
ncbi:MAG: hypothetical protein HY036_09350 [Nitrospirae bacterium]|nr:hypothetical protein [Nitrospirota bacterium]